MRYHRQAVSAMDESLRDAFGHPLDDYDVLHQVIAEGGGGIRMGVLAERHLLANSSCTRIVGRLVDAGYLERARGQSDRREVLVAATTAGRRLHRRMAAVHTRDIERWFSKPLSSAGRSGLDLALHELLDPDAAP